MTFWLAIDSESDPEEIGRALSVVASKLRNGNHGTVASGNVHDSKGETIGTWSYAGDGAVIKVRG